MSVRIRSGFVVGRLRERLVITGQIIVVAVMAHRNVRQCAKEIAGIAHALLVVGGDANMAHFPMGHAQDQFPDVNRCVVCVQNVLWLFGVLAQ